jgi:hypothetical protein
MVVEFSSLLATEQRNMKLIQCLERAVLHSQIPDPSFDINHVRSVWVVTRVPSSLAPDRREYIP